MRDFWYDVGLPLVVIGGILAVIVVSLIAFASVWNKYECANLNEVTGRRTDWRLFGGCYVEHEGEMLPYERWKLLEVRVKTRK